MRRWILGIVLLICAAVAALWLLSRMPPAWYQPPDASSPAVIELADRVEYRLVQEAQKPRAPDTESWTLRVREEQINAWLAARLEKWIAHEGGRWPDSLDPPQVHLHAQAIDIALPFRSSASRVLVVSVKPELEQGLLQIEIESVALGRLRLPGEPLAHLIQWLTEHAPDALDHESLTPALNALQQRQKINPVLELNDGRIIQLLDLNLGDGHIDLSARTLNEPADE